MVEQQFQKPHSTNAPPYQAKCATDKEKTTKTNVSNPMSKQILKNTPSQSRERPLSLQLPPAAIGYHVAKRNPAATITLRHTTKCSTSDYTFCRRIIGKTTHHNLPHYDIFGRDHATILPPCDIVGKDYPHPLPPYNIVGRGHATILLLNIIGGEPIFRDNESWLSRARVIFTITRGSYRERGHFSR